MHNIQCLDRFFQGLPIWHFTDIGTSASHPTYVSITMRVIT
jgi:hypothetical protein